MNYRQPLLDASLTDLHEHSLSSYHMHATASHVVDGDGALQVPMGHADHAPHPDFVRLTADWMSPTELEQLFNGIHEKCESSAPLAHRLTQPARPSAGGEDSGVEASTSLHRT